MIPGRSIRDALPTRSLVKDTSGTTFGGAISVIANAATGIGGDEDPLNAAYFQQARLLTRQQVEAALISCGEVQRLVKGIPADATAKGWTLTDDTHSPDPLARIQRRTKFRRMVRRAAAMARLYGEAFLLPILRLNGNAPTMEQLSRPLDLSQVTGVVRWEMPMGGLAREVIVVERQTELCGDIQVGEPLVYRVIMARAGPVFGPVNVHASWMLKFTGNWISPKVVIATSQYLPGEAMSVIQAVVYALYNWLESGNSNRRAQQQISQQVLRTSLFPAPDAPQEYTRKVIERWSAFSFGSALKTVVLDAGEGDDPGETLERLDFPVAGLDKLDDGALTHLAAASGLAKEWWGGLQASGFFNNGDSWQAAHWTTIEQYQEDVLREPMEAAIDIMAAASGLEPGSVDLTFNPLGQQAPKDKADTEKVEAETLNIYKQMGALPAEQVRRSKFGAGATPPAGVQPATPAEEAMEAAPTVEAGRWGAPKAPAPVEPLAAPEDADEDDATGEEIAAALNARGAVACGHGLVKRCPECGVRGIRLPVMGPDGAHVLGANGKRAFTVEWRAV